MKVLILYFSRSGNTKKLAEEIARGVVEIEGVETGTRPAGEAVAADDALAPEEPQRDQEL